MKRNYSRILSYWISLVLLLCSGQLLAQTTSIAPGNWSDPAIWSTGIVPGASDQVIINTNVTVDVANASVNILTINAGHTLTLGNGDLTVGNATIIRGSLTDSNFGGVNTFIGDVTVDAGGNLNFPLITNATDLVFRGNINCNGTFFADRCTIFPTSVGLGLTGSTIAAFNSVTISGTIDYGLGALPAVAGQMQVNIELLSAGGGRLVVQHSGATFRYRGSGPLLSTQIDASNGGVAYELSGPQTISLPSFARLFLLNGGTKTLNTNITVSTELQIAGPVTFDQGNFPMSMSGPTLTYLNNGNHQGTSSATFTFAATLSGQLSGGGFVRCTGGTREFIISGGTVAIPSGTNLNFPFSLGESTNVVLTGGASVDNSGQFIIGNSLLGTGAGGIWTNLTGSFLLVGGDMFPTVGNLNASSPNNTVAYASATGGAIKTPIGNEYWELELTGGTGSFSPTDNLTVRNIRFFTAASLNLASHDLTLTGDILNGVDGKIVQNLGANLFVNGNRNQTIESAGPGGAYTFGNMRFTRNASGDAPGALVTVNIGSNITTDEIIIENSSPLAGSTERLRVNFGNAEVTNLSSTTTSTTVESFCELESSNLNVGFLLHNTGTGRIPNMAPQSTLRLTGTNQNLSPNTLSIGHLFVGNTTGFKQINQHLTVSDLILEGPNATLIGAGTGFSLNVRGNWENSGGAFIDNGSIVEFQDVAAVQTIRNTAGPQLFGRVRIDKSAGLVRMLSDVQAISPGTTFYLNAGTFEVNGFNLTASMLDAGSSSTSARVLNYSNSTITITGTGNVLYFTGSGGIEATIAATNGELIFTDNTGDLFLELGNDTKSIGRISVPNNTFQVQLIHGLVPGVTLITSGFSALGNGVQVSFNATGELIFDGPFDAGVAGGVNAGSVSFGSSPGQLVFNGVVNIHVSGGVGFGLVPRQQLFSQDVFINSNNQFTSVFVEGSMNFAPGADLTIGENTITSINSAAAHTFRQVTLQSNSRTTFSGTANPTFEDITINSSGPFTLLSLSSNTTCNVSGVFQVNGTPGNEVFIRSGTAGTNAIINCSSSQTWTRARVQDINSIGAMITVISGIDNGNNLNNITFTAGNYFWVGGSGTWTDAGNWASVSGGAGGAGVPGINDIVEFDAASFPAPGAVVAIPAGSVCRTLNMSTVSNSPEFVFSGYLDVSGDLTLSANPTFTGPAGTGIRLPGSALASLTSNGALLNQLTVSGPAPKTLADELKVAGTLEIGINGNLAVAGQMMRIGGNVVVLGTLDAAVAGSELIMEGPDNAFLSGNISIPIFKLLKDDNTVNVSVLNALTVLNFGTTLLETGTLNLGVFNTAHTFGTVSGGTGSVLRLGATGGVLNFPSGNFASFASSGSVVAFSGSNYIISAGSLPPALPDVLLVDAGVKTFDGGYLFGGNVEIASGARLDIASGILIFTRNFTNLGLTVTTLPGAGIAFSGGNVQEFSSTNFAEVFSQVIVDKSDGWVNLQGTSIRALNTFELLNGIVRTNANRIIMGVGGPTPHTFNYTSGLIEGTLERWFPTGPLANPAFFPVGDPAGVNRWVTLSPLGSVSGGSVAVRFVPSDPGTSGLPASDGAVVLDQVFTEGYWVVEQLNGFSFGTSFDIEVESVNFVSQSGLERSQLIARTAGGGNPWVTTIGSPSVTNVTTASRLNVPGGFCCLEFGLAVASVTPPTVQAEFVNFTPMAGGLMEIGWTNGDGEGRLVVAYPASASPFFPQDFTEYDVAPEFDGDDNEMSEETENYAVYQGTGNSVIVSGFRPGEEYVVAVYEYNGSSPNFVYLTTPATINPNQILYPAINTTILRLNTMIVRPGEQLLVGFSAVGNFNSESSFVVELSNINGSFANPIEIGSAFGNLTTGTITATLPTNLPVGTGYRIRVVSYFPDVIGQDNGADLTVVGPPQLTQVPSDQLIYTEAQADPLRTFGQLIINNFGFPTITAARLAIAGYRVGEDTLVFTTPIPNQISVAFEPALGVWNLTGEATVAEYQTLLRSAAYANRSRAVVNDALRAVQVSVSNGFAASVGIERQFRLRALNDAPILAPTSDTRLPQQVENDANPAAISVLALIERYALYTDPDTTDRRGVAIIQANTANGSWQFTLDGGGEWRNVGNRTEATALLLPANAATRLRFVPALNFFGQINQVISFRAWDQTLGLPGATATTVPNGDRTAFSTESVSLGLEVLRVNDPPTFRLTSTQVVTDEDAPPFVLIEFATDIDDGDPDVVQVLTFRLTVTDSTGTLTFTQRPAISPTGTLTFAAAPNANGSAIVQVLLQDDGSNEFPNRNASQPQTFTILVRPVNDPPLFSLSTHSLVLDENFSTPVVLTVQPAPIPADEANQIVVYTVSPTSAPFVNVAINSSSGALTFTSRPNLFGEQRFVVTANDGQTVNNLATDTLLVRVNKVNDPPTDILLSNLLIPGNPLPGAIIGTLTATDPDPLDQHLFSLVSGEGDADNSRFAIQGNRLTALQLPDFREQQQFRIRVKADDRDGGTFEKAFQLRMLPPVLSTADSLALVRVLESTQRALPWNTGQRAFEWPGVTIVDGRVTALNLSGYQLPRIDVQAILSIPTLRELNVSDNRLTFEFLAPLANRFETFIFAPQGPLEEPARVFAYIVRDVTLSTRPTTTQDRFQWLKNGEPLSGQTFSRLTLTDLRISNSGTYSCLVTHPLFPGFALVRSNIELQVVEALNVQDSTALITIYNTLGAGARRLTWNFNEPASTWEGLVTELDRVVELNLSNYSLTGIMPEAIGEFPRLRKLDLFNNQIRGRLPASIGKLTELTYLDLDRNELTEIPAEIGQLTRLQTLWLSRNRLNALPNVFGNLTRLENLFLQENQIAQLPASLLALNSLEQLNIANNRQEGTFRVPAAWSRLRRLILADNAFTNVEGLGALTQLSFLDLQGNRLREVPAGVQSSTSLRNLTIRRNLLDFADLEPQIATDRILLYAPQSRLFEDRSQVVPAGGSVTLNAEIGGTANRYQWIRNDVLIPGANAPSFTVTNFSAAQAGVYYCVVTNTLLPDLTLESARVTLSPNCSGIPPLSISTTFPTRFCEGQSIYSLLQVPNLPGHTYQWLRNGERLALAREHVYAVFEAGSYQVQMTTPEGCTIASNTLTISVSPVSVPVVTLSNATLQATAGGQQGNFQWFRNGQAISGANQASLIATEPGSYSVGFTNQAGCIVFSEPVAVTVTSIEDNELSKSLMVYPNPSEGVYEIQWPGQMSGAVQLLVWDLTGRLVHRQEAIAGQPCTLQLNWLPAGQYQLELLTPQGRAVKKLGKR